jgi:DNA-binding PadR family transcriptional regulator
MTLNEALILSYVKRGIGYGYNILTHVKESRSDEWVEFSRAGLYKTLDKLEKSGFIGKKFEQDGGRPPKKVFSITPAGNKALGDFLDREFDFNFQTKFEFDAYLVTAVAASPDADTLLTTVQKRKEAVRRQLDTLKEDWPEDKDSYPFIVYVLFKRRLESLEMEYTWLEWFEGILKTVSGDVLHMTWGESRI